MGINFFSLPHLSHRQQSRDTLCAFDNTSISVAISGAVWLRIQGTLSIYRLRFLFILLHLFLYHQVAGGGCVCESGL